MDGNELLRCKNNTWGSFAEAKEQHDLGIVTGRCSGSIHAACRDIFHPDSDNYLCIRCQQQQPQSKVTEADVLAPTFVHKIMAEATASEVPKNFQQDGKERKERVALWTELTSLIDTMGQRLHCETHESERDSNHEDVQNIINTIDKCKKDLEKIEAKQKAHEETVREDGLKAKLDLVEIMLSNAREDTLRAKIGRDLSSAHKEVELIGIFKEKYSKLTSLSKFFNKFISGLRDEKDVKQKALDKAEELTIARKVFFAFCSYIHHTRPDPITKRKGLAESKAESAERHFKEAEGTFEQKKSEHKSTEQNYERAEKGASALTLAIKAANKWLLPRCHSAGTSLVQSYQTDTLDMRQVIDGVQGASVAENVYKNQGPFGCFVVFYYIGRRYHRPRSRTSPRPSGRRCDAAGVSCGLACN